ncbi:ankyrin repeat domain [Cordyceps militaris]|uniref:Ankyrin repeat domain n=1 Tax=Cordyceps militaris TaxID=73501 RepID=A0A2H4SL06_CORMI|nr:ankyrin repeat domain [Cordyceps militaris]
MEPLAIQVQLGPGAMTQCVSTPRKEASCLRRTECLAKDHRRLPKTLKLFLDFSRRWSSEALLFFLAVSTVACRCIWVINPYCDCDALLPEYPTNKIHSSITILSLAHEKRYTMTTDSQRNPLRKFVGRLRAGSMSLISPRSSSNSSHDSGHNSHSFSPRRRTNSPRNSLSSLAAAAAREAGLSLDLWNAAYDSLRDGPSTSGLVLTYESIVSQELPSHMKTGGMTMNFRGRSDEDRLRLLQEIMGAGLGKRRGSRTNQGESQARTTIDAAKAAIDAVVPLYMSSAVAWAGICTMTPLLLDPILRLDYMYAGFSHVLGRIDFYMTLASLLVPGSWRDEAKFRSQQDAVRDQISRQYRKILEFEMNCVCAAGSAWNPAAKNVVDWNGLAGMIKRIEEADEELVDRIKVNTTAVARHRLLKSYKDLEPLAMSADSMNHHHMAAIATAVAA